MATNQTTGPQAGADGSVTDLNERRETTYVILQQGENGGFWPVGSTDEQDKHIAAGSGKQAVNRYLSEFADDGEVDLTGNVYVAVPSRSWRPITVGGVEEIPAKRQFKLG